MVASNLSKSIRRTRPLCSHAVPVGSLKTLPNCGKITSHFWRISTRILPGTTARPRNDPGQPPAPEPATTPAPQAKAQATAAKKLPPFKPRRPLPQGRKAAFLITRIFKWTANDSPASWRRVGRPPQTCPFFQMAALCRDAATPNPACRTGAGLKMWLILLRRTAALGRKNSPAHKKQESSM